MTQPEADNFQDVNDHFVEQMWEITVNDLKELETIIIWEFESTEDSTKYFFIKNRLLASNHREKIESKLRFGGRFKFTNEIDTGDKIDHDQGGQLTSKSLSKILEKNNELKSEYSGEF